MVKFFFLHSTVAMEAFQTALCSTTSSDTSCIPQFLFHIMDGWFFASLFFFICPSIWSSLRFYSMFWKSVWVKLTSGMWRFYCYQFLSEPEKSHLSCVTEHFWQPNWFRSHGFCRRVSHRTHHQNHGHIEKDESWVPVCD